MKEHPVALTHRVRIEPAAAFSIMRFAKEERGRERHQGPVDGQRHKHASPRSKTEDGRTREGRHDGCGAAHKGHPGKHAHEALPAEHVAHHRHCDDRGPCRSKSLSDAPDHHGGDVVGKEDADGGQDVHRGRVGQGLGAAGSAVVAMAMVRDMFGGQGLVRMLARMALVSGIAPVVAPLRVRRSSASLLGEASLSRWPSTGR